MKGKLLFATGFALFGAGVWFADCRSRAPLPHPVGAVESDAGLLLFDASPAPASGVIVLTDANLVASTNLAMTTNHVLLQMAGRPEDGGHGGSYWVWYIDGGAEEFPELAGLLCAEACGSFATAPRDEGAVRFRFPYTDRMLRLVSDCLREQCGVEPKRSARPWP